VLPDKMIVSTEEIPNLDGLIETLAYANTPVYLYTRFRRDESVRKLAERNSSSSLIDSLKARLREAVVDPRLAARAYALLISLSFKPSYELGQLRQFSSNNLEWWDVLKSLVLADAPKESKIRVQLPSKPTV